MDNDTEIIKALKRIVAWSDFKSFCHERSKCTGCPYEKEKVCTLSCTERIMKQTVEAARKYLDEQGT